ncbi:MAG: DUF3144 domain-containing protein [Candidatus Thiodiazotropha endolucinida]|nr:DUF3144 domain-containing protein [Candidatus Thiodiazotropha endolucinida]
MQDSEFHEVADEFISLAAELSDKWSMPFLGTAFVYAAAQYNTRSFYKSDGSKSCHTSAVEYYCEQYRRMLLDCMNDYSKSH